LLARAGLGVERLFRGVRSRWLSAVLVAPMLFWCGASDQAAAAAAPAWSISILAVPTNFSPGVGSGANTYEVTAINAGTAPTSGGPVSFRAKLPVQLDLVAAQLPLAVEGSMVDAGPSLCSVQEQGSGDEVTCTVPSQMSPPFPVGGEQSALLHPGEGIRLLLRVSTVGAVEGQTLRAIAEVEGGGAEPAAAAAENEVSSAVAAPGFAEFRSGLVGSDALPSSRAGSHPYQYTISFALNTRPLPETNFFVPSGNPKDIRFALPPGLLADPGSTDRCAIVLFLEDACPNSAAVGILLLRQLDGNGTLTPMPLYNLVPPAGMPAQLGFRALTVPFYVNTELRTGADYGLTAYLQNLNVTKRITAATLILWGDPSDPSHDPVRGHCLSEGGPMRFSLGSCPGPVDSPFLRLPTWCGSELTTTASFDIWSQPGLFNSASFTTPPPTGCSSLPLAAELEMKPQTTVADSPTGLLMSLRIPRAGEGPDPADLRDLTLTLPEGIAVNPAGAQGLAACSATDAGSRSSSPGSAGVAFDAAPFRCPDAAKIGTITARTPLLDEALEGGIYAAAPGDNPFGSLLALYAEAAAPHAGTLLKLAGMVEADQRSGRLTVRFLDNPQIPLEDLEVRLFHGPRAVLRSPPTCGTYSSSAELLPWSAPESGPAMRVEDEFPVASVPGSKPCPETEAGAPLEPVLAAGTEEPVAGKATSLQLGVRREDGTQRISTLDVTLPAGVVAKLADVASCGEGALDAAAGRSGRAELDAPSCPADSRIGSIRLLAGSGPSPLSLDGIAFLAGPHKGAPLSIAAVVPAVAGPFDLGTIVVRMAVFVDPVTAQLRAVSDPLPSIRRGIPLDLRSLQLDLDRRDFVVNPTSCDPASVQATVGSFAGVGALVANRFQVGECSRLRFDPRLSVGLLGPTHRGAHPTLRIALRQAAGETNLRRAAVTLPRTQLLDSSNIGRVCSRARYTARDCPAQARVGYAVARSPLLDRTLEGPVFLRSTQHGLPEVVAALDGRFRLDLSARLDAVNGRLRATFPAVPDVPLSQVVLRIRGGRNGLLVNTGGVCAKTWKAGASFAAQDGKRRQRRAAVEAKCRRAEQKP
jgi:hypothetical protein